MSRARPSAAAPAKGPAAALAVGAVWCCICGAAAAAAMSGSGEPMGEVQGVRKEQSSPYRTALSSAGSALLWYVEGNEDGRGSGDSGGRRLMFELSVRGRPSLVGFGFSDWGERTSADFAIMWTDALSRRHFHDVWVDNFGRVIPDASQDYHLLSVRQQGNMTTLRFWRDANTCDSYDYKIDTGTTHVLLFAADGTAIRNLAAIDVAALDIGLTRIQLIKSPVPLPETDSTWKYFDVRAPSVKVPPQETTYWCTVRQLPALSLKHHIVKFEGVIDEASEGVVHHMEVFQCETSTARDAPPPPTYSGPCSNEEKPPELSVCSKVIGAWAMGAVPFVYPPEAGVPIGGRGGTRYVMLEVHYNNVARRRDIIDSSGIRFTITPLLREYDAAVMELGVIYDSRLSVPPTQKRFRLEGVCTSQCTEQALPPAGIKVFASQLHTHLTGKRVRTMHIRNGVRLEDLNADEHYSPHFQEIRLLRHPVTVLPGDALINVCEHDTTGRMNVTLGGFAISEEMCVNYAHYYPKSSLEVCKSAISTSSLDAFFSMMAYYMRDGTSAQGSVSQNMRRVSWNPISSRLLQWFYDTMPVEQACLRPDGTSHTGRWKDVPKPTPWFNLKFDDDECDLIESSYESIDNTTHSAVVAENS